MGLKPEIGETLKEHHNIDRSLRLKDAIYLAKTQEDVLNRKDGATDFLDTMEVSNPFLYAPKVFDEMPSMLGNDVQEIIKEYENEDDTQESFNGDVLNKNGKYNEISVNLRSETNLKMEENVGIKSEDKLSGSQLHQSSKLDKIGHWSIQDDRLLLDIRDNNLFKFKAIIHRWHKWKSKSWVFIMIIGGRYSKRKATGYRWHKWKSRRSFFIIILKGCCLNRITRVYMWHKWKAKLMLLIGFIKGWKAKLMLLVRIIKGCYTYRNTEFSWLEIILQPTNLLCIRVKGSYFSEGFSYEMKSCAGFKLLHFSENNHVYESILYKSVGTLDYVKQSKWSRNSESSQVGLPKEIGIGFLCYMKQFKWTDTGWVCNPTCNSSQIIEFRFVMKLVDQNRVLKVRLTPLETCCFYSRKLEERVSAFVMMHSYIGLYQWCSISKLLVPIVIMNGYYYIYGNIEFSWLDWVRQHELLIMEQMAGCVYSRDINRGAIEFWFRICLRVMLGVSLVDMLKGIPQKISAFEKFLEGYPHWSDKVVLLQFAIPTRTNGSEYQKSKDREAILKVELCDLKKENFKDLDLENVVATKTCKIDALTSKLELLELENTSISVQLDSQQSRENLTKGVISNVELDVLKLRLIRKEFRTPTYWMLDVEIVKKIKLGSVKMAKQYRRGIIPVRTSMYCISRYAIGICFEVHCVK
ncbi:putative alpha,alpha-trehalose-phosphate synthase (UDP-forming) [Helianthus anomalus]